LPAGISYASLRLSTIVLALGGMAAFCDLLARRSRQPALAAAATAVLVFNPVFFRLSLSFMTDVPLISLVAIGYWLAFAGFERRRTACIVAAVALLVGAYLVRELAVVAPFALLAGAVLAMPRLLSLRLAAGLAVLATIGVVLAALWLPSFYGVTSGLATRTRGLGYVLAVPPIDYVRALAAMALTVGVFVAPLALATIGRRDVRWILAIATPLVAIAPGIGAMPFDRNQVMSPLGLGMSRALLPGAIETTPAGDALRVLALGLGAVSIAVSLRAAGEVLRSRSRSRDAADVAWLILAAGEAGALLVLWLWQDRYDLILVPSVLWLLAVRAARVGWSRAVVFAGVGAFGALAVLGTRDDVELNRAVAAAEQWLRTRGVEARAIDAGYASNGWRLYAAADEFAPGFPPERVPFLFSREALPYVVSSTPLPRARALRELEWRRSWLSAPRLYALERDAS
jgi:hypothetical protein